MCNALFKQIIEARLSNISSAKPTSFPALPASTFMVPCDQSRTMFSNVNALWEVGSSSSHGFSNPLIFRVFPVSFTLALRQKKTIAIYVFQFYLYPWSFVSMPFSFFCFAFYIFKKTGCDESAERSQGDEPTRCEKNKSLPNWISSFTKVRIFSHESPDLLALNAKPYRPCLHLLINRNIFLSGLKFRKPQRWKFR